MGNNSQTSLIGFCVGEEATTYVPACVSVCLFLMEYTYMSEAADEPISRARLASLGLKSWTNITPPPPTLMEMGFLMFVIRRMCVDAADGVSGLSDTLKWNSIKKKI